MMDKENKMIDYRGLDKNLTKEDLNEEELDCYNKLMAGIKGSSKEEKEEVAHLMEVFIATGEGVPTQCMRCGKKFEDTFVGATEDNKRIYCNACLRKMWGSSEEE